MAGMPPQADHLHRYLRHRRYFELGFWVVFFVGQATANSVTVWMEIQRRNAQLAHWEVVTWEFSSNLALLLLVPAVVLALDRWPLHWGVLKSHLARHFGFSLMFSVVHVLLMVGARKAVYAAQGQLYDFGRWPGALLYESIKDVRAYALMVALVFGYRLLLWRLQGEATLLQRPDEPPQSEAEQTQSGPEPSLPPERFLVKKLGKEFLLPTREIEWLQACGNYVNLHRLGHDYPLRATLAAMEARLGSGFFRVHRSYLVNLEMVAAIEPTEFGDARLQIKTGAAVPCSRSYLEALRQRLV